MIDRLESTAIAECLRVLSVYESERGGPVVAEDVATALGISARSLFRKLASTADAIFWDHYTYHVPRLTKSLEARRADPFADIILELTDLLRSAGDPFEVRRQKVVRSSLVLKDREIVLMGRYRRLIASSLGSGAGVAGALAEVAAAGVMAMFRPAAETIVAEADSSDAITAFIRNAEAIRDATHSDSARPRVFVIESSLDAQQVAERLDAKLIELRASRR